MNMIKKSFVALAIAMASTVMSANASEAVNPQIEQYVQKLCGDDAACADKKRAEYQDRMASYNEYVSNKCGDDEACRAEMKAKYMERRARREERIAQHCGEDEACRDELREKYSLRMKEGREKCGQDKACWNEFYDENKPE